MTKDEAEEELLKYNAENIWYCPLIMEQCRKDCLCYHPARVERGPISTGAYCMWPAKCTHVHHN